MKTAQHLDGFLRQNSVNFGENFRKINQTAKFPRSNAAMLQGFFMTLSSTMQNH